MDSQAMITIVDVNAMSPAQFVSAFGDVAEHSPWVAERAMARRPFASRDSMVDAFSDVMLAASDDAQLDLLCAHPDLANRAKLTTDSTLEQAGAGLDKLSPDEFARFTALNETYKSRFGFPFIFAVKGATKAQILTSFEQRIGRSRPEEFDMALTQVCRIFRFRIEDRVSA